MRVHRLRSLDERVLEQLEEVLIDCVEGGASVSFMLPLSRQKAGEYWRGVAESAVRGERALLAALDSSGRIVGTVQLMLNLPENQPHRGDLAKMLVHRRARRAGVGAALLTAAEECARAEGRSLLVLDTASATAGNGSESSPVTRSTRTAGPARPLSTSSRCSDPHAGGGAVKPRHTAA